MLLLKLLCQLALGTAISGAVINPLDRSNAGKAPDKPQNDTIANDGELLADPTVDPRFVTDFIALPEKLNEKSVYMAILKTIIYFAKKPYLDNIDKVVFKWPGYEDVTIDFLPDPLGVVLKTWHALSALYEALEIMSEHTEFHFTGFKLYWHERGPGAAGTLLGRMSISSRGSAPTSSKASGFNSGETGASAVMEGQGQPQNASHSGSTLYSNAALSALKRGVKVDFKPHSASLSPCGMARILSSAMISWAKARTAAHPSRLSELDNAFYNPYFGITFKMFFWDYKPRAIAPFMTFDDIFVAISNVALYVFEHSTFRVGRFVLVLGEQEIPVAIGDLSKLTGGGGVGNATTEIAPLSQSSWTSIA